MEGADIGQPTRRPEVKAILDAIESLDATSADFAALDVPEHYRGITVHRDEQDMFAGLPTREKDPPTRRACISSSGQCQ